MKRIALVGDYSETITAHRAIPIALELAVKRAQVVIEYAENVWHIPAPDAETDPAASDPVIAPLACALVDVQGLLRFAPASRLRRI